MYNFTLGLTTEFFWSQVTQLSKVKVVVDAEVPSYPLRALHLGVL